MNGNVPADRVETMYRCFSPSRAEAAEDSHGYAYSTDPDTFYEMPDERNSPSAPAPHDWEFQSAHLVWERADQ